MEEHPLTIPIDKIKDDFQEFLNPKHNRRIIFSGPFGIGKTYFLNEFFKEKDEYFPIFLRPVNYSLLSNEDIFKFIKYDILVQLISKQIIKVGRDLGVSRVSSAKSFVLNNKILILRNLLKVIPNLGGVSEGIDSFQELYKKYREGLDKAEDFDSDLATDFKEDLENNFLLEYDRVSEFIKEKLHKIENKKVLIIDDLDRLDPEHIFRLFNVFSAHFDQVHYYENSEGNDNKFGFDQIIFVCDIENIRKIFAHKYGEQVDFSGYIDKFYSLRPFYLNNTKYIYEYINNSLSIEKIPDDIIEVVRIITSNLFWNGRINLRTLEKLFKEKIPNEMYNDDDQLLVDNFYDVKAKYLNWIRYLSVLKPIFGKYSELISELKKLPEDRYVEIDKSRFLKIREILANTYAVLKSDNIKSLISKKKNVPRSNFPNELVVLTFGPNVQINVNVSITRKQSRYFIYEVNIYDEGNIPTFVNTFELVDFFIKTINAGRYLHILEED